jgi:hypothetical protein
VSMTLAYMAPEHRLNAKEWTAGYLFSLGVMKSQLLVGDVPRGPTAPPLFTRPNGQRPDASPEVPIRRPDDRYPRCRKLFALASTARLRQSRPRPPAPAAHPGSGSRRARSRPSPPRARAHPLLRAPCWCWCAASAPVAPPERP